MNCLKYPQFYWKPNMRDYLITNVDFLYRRFPISDEPNYASFWKLENGKKIPSSAAFKTKPDEEGLSVNIAALTTPQQTVDDNKKFGVAEISAETPLHLGYECEHRPVVDNVAHALILGNTKKIAKKLSRAVSNVFDFLNSEEE